MPTAELLNELPADRWAILQKHARAALRTLEPAQLTPRLTQLRALPPSKLSSGRARRDLCEALSAGGPLWVATATNLLSDAAAADVVETLRTGDLPATTAPPAPEPTTDDAELRAARDRARRSLAERDDALRRLDGAEARARAAQDRAGDLAGDLAAARERIEQLEAAVAAADERHRQEQERERRRHEAVVARLEDELKELRRAEDARRKRERQREEQAGRETRRPAPRTTRPTLDDPDRLRPGTTEHARAHLRRGRLVVVDGYNVAKQAHPDVALAEQRTWLIKLLEGTAVRFGVHPMVIFDASEALPAGHGPVSRAVKVVFASETESADDEIVFEVSARDDVVVVTDDRELQGRVRAVGADAIGTVPFLSAVQ